ncbi:MAG: hypothetical protein KJ607_13530 [Bacteroidetes bacterium]|nr:hypothetical protein [Bacteroidota bacterium]
MSLKRIRACFSAIGSFIRIAGFLRAADNLDFEAFYSRLEIPQDEKRRYLLDAVKYNRARQYLYAFYTLGRSFCGLFGRKMNPEEQYRLILLSHLACCFDDFFDETDICKNTINEMIRSPESFLPKSYGQSHFIRFYKPLYKSVQDRESFFRYLALLVDFQQRSRQQAAPGISPEEIAHIMTGKGGYAALVIRSALDKPLAEGEEKAVMQLGKTSQLQDDIFDCYDDTKRGIKTIANATTDIEGLLKLYRKEFSATLGLFAGLPYPAREKNEFLGFFIVLFSQGFVCLYRFLRLKRKYGHFSVCRFSRNETICDMEKTGPRIRLFLHSVKNHQRFSYLFV